MRLIDVDAFVRSVVKSGFGAEFINRITALLIDAPSLDLVRCGECKYCEDYESMEGMEYICGRAWCSPYDWADRPYFYVKPDGFCSYAERKESE